MNKLNIGCGKDVREGWVNLDKIANPGVDVVVNWGQAIELPFTADFFDEVYCSHVLEHIDNPLRAMETLHTVCKDGAKAVFRLPYGSSDNAWEDPTHVRPYFIRSFSYFSQVMYYNADYGYRGDWEVEEIKLIVPIVKHLLDMGDMMKNIERYRNIVDEMIVTMRCVKPIRTAIKDDTTQFRLMIEAV